MQNILKWICVIVICGSIFIVSAKFVNVYNIPKVYFVHLSLIVGVIGYIVPTNKFYFPCLKDLYTICFGILFIVWLYWYIDFWITAVCLVLFGKMILQLLPSQKEALGKWIFIAGVLQALYFIGQFSGLINVLVGEEYGIGSFDNPAGFACIEALICPLGLFFFYRSPAWGRYFYLIGIVFIVCAVFLCDSRTGEFALCGGIVIYLFLLLRISFFKKIVLLAIIISVIIGGIYFSGKGFDSVKGRWLIWNVTKNMIEDEFWCGFGKGGFQAQYMQYQAAFFEDHPLHEDSLLADNVKHPFNEFMLICCEHGMLGLIGFITVGGGMIIAVSKLKREFRAIIYSCIFIFCCFCLFSYPSHYISVWLVLLFYFLFPLENVKCFIIYKKRRVINLFLSGLLILLLGITLKNMRLELQWKTLLNTAAANETNDFLLSYERLYRTFKNPLFFYSYAAELNREGEYLKSNQIMQKYLQINCDYDALMIIADNYYNMEELTIAEELYTKAAFMIPCRFWPLYRLFCIYRLIGDKEQAVKIAKILVNKKIKVYSSVIFQMQQEVQKYIHENK